MKYKAGYLFEPCSTRCYHGERENSEYQMPVKIPVMQYEDCTAGIKGNCTICLDVLNILMLSGQKQPDNFT